MDWARQWTIGIRLNESAFAIMEPPAESTLWQGFMVLLMVHQNILTFHMLSIKTLTVLYHCEYHKIVIALSTELGVSLLCRHHWRSDQCDNINGGGSED